MAKKKRLRGKMDKSASPAEVQGRSREQQYAEGKAIRNTCLRESHAKWKPPTDHADPVEILEASNKGRLPELIPVRYGRMIPSPLCLLPRCGGDHGVQSGWHMVAFYRINPRFGSMKHRKMR